MPTGRVAVVTSSGRCLGRADARAITAAGAAVDSLSNALLRKTVLLGTYCAQERRRADETRDSVQSDMEKGEIGR